jgi:hypothetical protein
MNPMDGGAAGSRTAILLATGQRHLESTGPTTVAGLARSRRARWKHGAYSRETRAWRALARRNHERVQTLQVRGKELGLW